MAILSPKSRNLTILSIVGLLAVNLQMPAWSKLSASQLTSLVRSNARARVSAPTVLGEGPTVTVLVEKNSNASDKELKIDAIFLGKTLIDGASGQVTDIKVLFSQQDREGRYIQINSQQINDFGSGKIDADKFLSSVQLVSVAGESTPDVVQGPEFERRLLVWKRIDHLRKMGTGVRPFETAFKDLETIAKSGKTDGLSEKISNLERVLSQQENILKEAKRVARGKGITTASGGKTFGQASANARANTSATGGSSGFIPAEANQIKSAFSQKAEALIRQVEVRDRAKGQSLRAMKNNIDQLFASGKQADAFRVIHDFQLAVQQATGIDFMAPEGGHPGGGGGGQGGFPGGGPPGGGGGQGGFPGGGPPGGGPPGGQGGGPPF